MHKIIEYINTTCDLDDEYYQIFQRHLPTGKFICPNPEHQHVNNTPSCKRYGNVFKCFGQCNRVFGVYDLLKWYNPKRIDELKTQLIPDMQQKPREAITKTNVNASTIKEALYQITGICL